MGLRRDEEHAKEVLSKEFGVTPYVYYFGTDDYGDDEYITRRISGVTIVYHERDMREQLRKGVIAAMLNAVVDGDDFMYAGNLREELEDIGIYGMSIWDSRDAVKHKLLTRTAATGRLRRAYERGWTRCVTLDHVSEERAAAESAAAESAAAE